MYRAMDQDRKTGQPPLIERYPILVGVAAGVAFVALLGLGGILW